MDTRRDQAKEQILQATITCIEKWGIAGVTARRVAQIAGVNIAAINYYFGTKENLLNETFKTTSEHLSLDTGMLLSAKSLSSFSLIKIFLTFISIGIHKYPRLVHTFINNPDVAPEYLQSLQDNFHVFVRSAAECMVHENPSIVPIDAERSIVQMIYGVLGTSLTFMINETGWGDLSNPSLREAYIDFLVSRYITWVSLDQITRERPMVERYLTLLFDSDWPGPKKSSD